MSIRKWIFTLVLAGFLTACSSHVTRENFEKVDVGMAQDQVVKLLGEPTKTTSLTLGELSGTTAYWQHEGSQITIQFINNKVIMKNFTAEPKENKATDTKK